MNRQFDKFTAIYTRIDYPGDSWAVQVQMRSLEQYAKEQGLRPLATCSYAVVWLKRHPEF